jgi:hypothetical protein
LRVAYSFRLHVYAVGLLIFKKDPTWRDDDLVKLARSKSSHVEHMWQKPPRTVKSRALCSSNNYLLHTRYAMAHQTVNSAPQSLVPYLPNTY